jgi:hypothetical protein
VDGVQAAQGTQTALTTPPHKWLIAAAVMLGCALEVLDSFICTSREQWERLCDSMVLPRRTQVHDS